MKSIVDVPDLRGKKVLLRASLNVPIENGEVIDDFRIRKAMKTIDYLVGEGAKVVIIAHIGREKTDTLESVYQAMRRRMSLLWCGDFSEAKEMTDALENGEALLLENLRCNEGEKKNDDTFAKELASLTDIYVNDAFAASHRAHASIVGIPKHLPSYMGLNFEKEYHTLEEVRTPESPSLFILGGAKFETKAPLITQYADIYDRVFVGGALANDFFKAKGFEVGTSLVSSVAVDDALLSRENILLPVDVTVRNATGEVRVTSPDDVRSNEMILDAGPETMKMLATYVAEAQTILWNGPLGNYEEGFAEYTEALADLIATSDAYSVVGGGDTIASIAKLQLEDRFSFLSTAGGAMLVFLETGTLPGIEALT
ncbi:phosphoglycerate kinase [Candidatus Kaiserbacteria bacterium]|nr:phosphoglycerate kinase [Candidatus Kaiserbacteria bacterium]